MNFTNMDITMKNEFDFVAIGDTTTDAFIRIAQASVYYDNKDHEEKICLTNGTKIPYESLSVVTAVGNSPNAAVSAARLGLSCALVSDWGDDEYGRACMARLASEGVATDYISVHKGKQSNYHFVLWHKAERTILIKHEEYPYKLPDIGNPKWVYFSSVGEHSLPYHDEIATYLESHPSVKFAFQPGTFQIKLGYERLKRLYARTEVFFCNKEESQIILKSAEDSLGALAGAIRALGPNIAVITDGPHGACVASEGETVFMPPYPDIAPPYERTGAGDAFASTFTSALALGKTPAEAITWAPINSMSVVQKIGAQEGLLSRNALEEYLKNAPAEYKARKA